MRHTQVADVHGVSLLRRLVKSTLAGKMAVALWRQRHAPVVALRAWRRARADGPPPDPRCVRCRAVFVILCGPGELDRLTDTIASIERYEGEDARIVVAEDATPDVRWPQVRARHPGVDVVRARWPTGGPPRLSPPLALAYRHVAAHYDCEVVVKLDTDALVTGSGLSLDARARFAEQPDVGLLGTVGMRADGVPEDYTYDDWMLGHEVRWSPTVRALLARARVGSYSGAKVHGGVYAIAPRAIAAVAAAGDLDRKPPWWSQIGEDLWFSLAVCAAGFRLESWGAPGEPTASGSKFLPVELGEVEPRGVLAAHSVRRGFGGEDEEQVRAYFRARREAS